MPFRTPAAEAYQATAAVTMPAQPPACVSHALPPWASVKNPAVSRHSVICNVRKTRKTAMVTFMLEISM